MIRFICCLSFLPMIGPKGILKGAIALRSNVMTDTGKHFAEMRGGVLSAISTLSVLWIERPSGIFAGNVRI